MNTTEFPIIVYLESQGIKYKEIETLGKKAIFHYNEDITKHEDDCYNGKAKISPFDYSSIQKRLKSIIQRQLNSKRSYY